MWETTSHVRNSMKNVARFFVFSMVLSGLAAAQTAWFGIAPPPGLSDPTKPVLKYDAAFAPMQANFAHDEFLDSAALKKDLARIVGFSLESYRSGDKLWGRRAGTPSLQHTLEWTAAEFKAAGLKDAHVESFAVPGNMWVPQAWQVQLIGDDAFGPGSKNITLGSAFPQQGGSAAELAAPAIYVGRGSDADLAGRDVKGKIAVVHIRPEPSLFGSAEQGVAAKLVEHGAVGVIEAVEGPANILYYDPRFACGTAPCFLVGGQDGWFLEQAIGKAGGRLNVKVSLTSTQQGGLKSANVIAVIPGKSEKRIIINAHADGYFQGADDNASGLATLMALSRYFAKQPQPEHTLMFVASGGHHGPGNGPTALLAAHPELKGNTLLVLNLEHVAYSDVVRGKTRAQGNFGMVWETSVTESAKAVGVTNEAPFLINLWKQAPRCFGVATYQQASTGVPGDLGGCRALGVPMTQMIQSGPFYHSSGDVFEAVPPAGMERAARFHSYFIREVDRAPEAMITGATSSSAAVCESVSLAR
jgi:hypothetical protein